MKYYLLAACLLFSASLFSQANPYPSIKNYLVGTWKIIGYERKNENGHTIEIENGKSREVDSIGQPTGFLVYDAYGNMAVQVVYAGHVLFPAGNMLEVADRYGKDTLIRALTTYSSYYGKYQVDSIHQIITHQVERSSLNYEASPLQKRAYQIRDANTLYLESPQPIPLPDGHSYTFRVIWKRIGKE